jgi:hypothetical protein
MIAWFRRVDEFVATAPVSLLMLMSALIGIGLAALIVLAAR